MSNEGFVALLLNFLHYMWHYQAIQSFGLYCLITDTVLNIGLLSLQRYL